ncbi:MAG: universal stress protein [Bacteroidia bacterium]|nr:universal stress protein [Bacteroidia bacterium]
MKNTDFLKKILIPLDFSKTSLKALDYAGIIAKKSGAEILLLHVIENIYVTTDPFYAGIPMASSYETDLLKISKANLDKVAGTLKKSGAVTVSTLSTTGRTHAEILNTAKEVKAGLIVMGTHGVSGFREFVMGSNTYRVVNDSIIPVMSVQHHNKAAAFKNILLPFSDRPHSREKIKLAIQFAGIFNSTLHILGIDDEMTKSHSRKIALEADQLKGFVSKHDINSVIKVISEPYHVNTVLSYAKKIKADLILTMGDTARQDFTEYFTGSFSQQLVNHSPVPVLSVHSKWDPNAVEGWAGI